MRRSVGWVVAALMVAASCTGDDTGHGDGPAAPDDRRGASTSTAGTAPPRRGGILRVGSEEMRSLDPAQARSGSELVAADLIFDALGAYDPVTGDVVPALADRWAATPDQMHWDFHLRPGTAFHNGRGVTAADVVFSLERVVRKGSGAPELIVAQLEPVAGFRAFNVDGTSADLAGVSAPAADVVRIDLDQPLAALPAVLAHPALGVVAREAVEAASPPFAEEPVGTGPFRVAGRERGRVHLVRADGSAALLDGIDLVESADAGGAYQSFRDGEVDWSPVPSDQVDDATERYGQDGFAPYLAVLFYGFNLGSPKFADPRFREAVVRAVDRQAIARAVYGDSVLPVDGLVGRGMPGHQENACGIRCRHDPAAARALLAQTFPAGGIPELAIDYDDDATQAAIARAIQANLAEVGIKASLRAHPFDEYAEVVERGEQELFRLGWIGVYPGPDNFLTPLFLTGTSTNVTGFSVPPIDDLLRLARATADPAQRLARYQDAERQIMNLVPILPIAQFRTRAVVAEQVRGLQLNAAGTFDGSKVWLAG